MPTLKRIIKENTGQDISRCQACLDCEVSCPEDMDIPLGSMIQMAMYDDEDVLTCRTLWSNCVLKKASLVCSRGLDIHKIMLALREEARQRGMV